MRPSLHNIARWLGIALLAGALVGISGTALAQSDGADTESEDEREEKELSDAEKKKFQRLVQEGRKAFEQKEWEASLEAFEQAYEIKPSANLLFNMGLVAEKAGNLGKAVEYYDKFVNSPGIKLELRKKAHKRLEDLEPIVEDSDREKRTEDERPEDQELETSETEAAAKSSDKEETGEDDEASDSGDAADANGGGGKARARGGGSALPAVLLVSGGASLLGSGGLFLAAQSNIDTFENGESPSARRTARDWHVRNTYLADGLLIAGAGLATTGLILWLSGSNNSSAKAETAQSPTVAPTVTPRGAGLSISGSF